MKRVLLFVVSVLAAALLTAPAASARTTFCLPESLRLLGTDGNDLCLGAPTPSITPPFTAFAEQNGTQNTWCLFTGPKYSGLVLRIPAFSGAGVFATFASGRPC
ncbi:hypothetical protein [Amycolatopsis sp. Hca4]|uniref:hypothetical protein n=1 Tax=Amycolatopsis sp. Hca4 TaxID=2742131 RepID=UPI001590251B|nr:hypothetical protein [Amycolatopsis sp. Hca4]QKV79178.1 hypothetical protein HUT10_39425 [Amycolatopsis sp. Hca4]